MEERSRILKANPLLLTDSYSSDQMGLKRRWDDDVVFRNQVKDAPKPKKRYLWRNIWKSLYFGIRCDMFV